jgi:hypothetical protein
VTYEYYIQVFFFSHIFSLHGIDVSAGWGVNKGFASFLEDISTIFQY